MSHKTRIRSALWMIPVAVLAILYLPTPYMGALMALLLLAGLTAAQYIRAKELVPLLVDHIPDRYSYFVYYGSRNAQPARARAFIDLVLERLVDNSAYVLSMKELRAAARAARVVSS